jgi:hypothetical protein
LRADGEWAGIEAAFAKRIVGGRGSIVIDVTGDEHFADAVPGSWSLRSRVRRKARASPTTDFLV